MVSALVLSRYAGGPDEPVRADLRPVAAHRPLLESLACSVLVAVRQGPFR